MKVNEKDPEIYRCLIFEIRCRAALPEKNEYRTGISQVRRVNTDVMVRGGFSRKSKAAARRKGLSPSGPKGYGGLAQLGERLLCKQEVSGSIPLISTSRESRRQIRLKPCKNKGERHDREAKLKQRLKIRANSSAG